MPAKIQEGRDGGTYGSDVIAQLGQTEARISKTETRLEGLGASLASTNATLQLFADKTDANFRELRVVLDKRTEPIGKTNWQVIFGAIATFLTIFGIWAVGPSRDQARTEEAGKKNSDRIERLTETINNAVSRLSVSYSESLSSAVKMTDDRLDGIERNRFTRPDADSRFSGVDKKLDDERERNYNLETEIKERLTRLEAIFESHLENPIRDFRQSDRVSDLGGREK